MKHGFYCITLAVLLAVFFGGSVAAESLSLSPLEYKATLQKGEKKKGHIDLVNPEPQTITVRLDVRGFKQADDDGGLDFFEDTKLQQGIILDLDEVELGPNEGARIYFLLDGDKLPAGDVFAAIMARGIGNGPSIGATPAVEVGTLMMLTNGAALDHHATIDSLHVPWWQTDQGLVAEMVVKNSDDPNGDALAFVPRISIETWPYGRKTVDGPLIFAGRSRTVQYRQPGNYFGPIKVTAAINGYSKSTWLFAVTGYWRLMAPLMVVVIIFAAVGIRYAVRRRHNRG